MFTGGQQSLGPVNTGLPLARAVRARNGPRGASPKGAGPPSGRSRAAKPRAPRPSISRRRTPCISVLQQEDRGVPHDAARRSPSAPGPNARQEVERWEVHAAVKGKGSGDKPGQKSAKDGHEMHVRTANQRQSVCSPSRARHEAPVARHRQARCGWMARRRSRTARASLRVRPWNDSERGVPGRGAPALEVPLSPTPGRSRRRGASARRHQRRSIDVHCVRSSPSVKVVPSASTLTSGDRRPAPRIRAAAGRCRSRGQPLTIKKSCFLPAADTRPGTPGTSALAARQRPAP